MTELQLLEIQLLAEKHKTAHLEETLWAALRLCQKVPEREARFLYTFLEGSLKMLGSKESKDVRRIS